MKKKPETKLNLGKIKISSLSKPDQGKIQGGKQKEKETVYPNCQVAWCEGCPKNLPIRIVNQKFLLLFKIIKALIIMKKKTTKKLSIGKIKIANLDKANQQKVKGGVYCHSDFLNCVLTEHNIHCREC